MSTNRPQFRETSLLKQDDLEEALGLVDRDYGASTERVPFEIRTLQPFGQLFPFTRDEKDQLQSLRDIVVRYVGQRSPPHPLCFVVFGPPGSGKSFAVKQIRAEILKGILNPKLKLPYTIINLTQLSDSAALARVLAQIAGEQDEDTVPIVFFDEFDGPKNSAPYGWLSWFLAPMHEGEFLHEGAIVRLKRAVYVFAGGTATTIDEFSKPHNLTAFRLAKGLDFISHLRGFLDVPSPNAEPRMLRRAVILRNELEDRAARNGAGVFRPDRKLLATLLQVGRYRHGARSIAAVAELSDIDAKKQHFRWEELPEDHLLALHIDRGPIDAKVIGGSIALSGYSSRHGESPGEAAAGSFASPADDVVAKCWRTVADSLWRQGATLSYAGSWGEDSGGQLMKSLAEDLQKRPVEPSRHQVRREHPEPWLESFLQESPDIPALKGVDAVVSEEDRDRFGLRVVIGTNLTDEEISGFRKNSELAQVIERFRRRLAVSEASVARFAVAGATTRHGGRFPGIAEELMLTLALGKPVYVAGGFGGAAVDVGSLLGLAPLRTGEVPSSLQADPQEKSLATIKEKLRPVPWTHLPVTSGELVAFFKKHAIGGARWPDNGLTAAENRRLFESENADEVARLVTQGLLRRFGGSNSLLCGP